jgi:hypothetical protein
LSGEILIFSRSKELTQISRLAVLIIRSEVREWIKGRLTICLVFQIEKAGLNFEKILKTPPIYKLQQIISNKFRIEDDRQKKRNLC